MAQFAKVIIERAVGREFDYRVPTLLEGSVHIGSKVRIPFGRQVLTGFVAHLSDHADFPDCKPIAEVIGTKPLIDTHLIELAKWMADYYCCPVETAMKSIMPEVVRKTALGWKERLFVTPKRDPSTEELSRLTKRAPKQAVMLEKVRSTGGLFLTDLISQTGGNRSSANALEDLGLVTIAAETQERDPFDDEVFLPTQPLKLNSEQMEALELVKQSINTLKPPVILLHGVTGSGKTEVYLQGIQHALHHGRGAIILVPEISLTPQTVERFKGRFAESNTLVAVLHSHLSPGERHDEWHKIHEGRARIVIGARSAVFAPVRDLGLIIVDEEHEGSYKQEKAPRYNARDVAVMRGHMMRASVLLGSATPSLESYHNAQRKKYHLCPLPGRIDDKKMPLMRIVDMCQEAMRQKGVQLFSERLKSAIQARLARSEQTILFLNRRGFASSMVCNVCGHVEMCPECSVALTFHRQKNILLCHLCGHSAKPPSQCPSCKDPKIRYAGMGTEKIEGALARIFPKARILRMDSDTMQQKESYREALGSFKTGKVDILVGTQMIAKGLHFPNVTLVGIVNADMGLHQSDFRAGERTFQLLTQVAGRAGRGDVEGEVIVQTFTPFHPAIQFARQHDYLGFYEQEIEFRKQLSYPPSSHMVILTLRGKSENKVKFVAETLQHTLGKNLPTHTILNEAAPAPLAKVESHYRFQILLRSPSILRLSDFLRESLKSFQNPVDVEIAIDVDPVSLT
ncbi:MAG: primosomal protein N' [Verrucomicrobiae bacterium]|nr:primosomal protein N' [Verrucomicrobiae bacterium]